MNVIEASIEDLPTALASGAVTAESLLKAYLDRIAQYDRAGIRLNAVVVAK